MNGEGRGKTNMALNLGTMTSLIIAITVGGFIVANVYDITKRVEQQSIANGDAVNQTISQILETQDKANTRGNLTILYFDKIFKQQLENENDIIGNLSHHRIVSNETRDQEIDLLKQILNQTR
jgi:ABC-type Na+ efflux pump permease subunit